MVDVSFNVDQEEILACLGRNGVGKTTTLRSIMGLTPIRNGKMKFAGCEISNEPVYSRTIMGMGYVPEYRGMFPELTVSENLMLATSGSKIKVTNKSLIISLS